jgi:hypothetical protein
VNALNMARQFIVEAESAYDVSEEKEFDSYYRGLSRYKYELAVTYAAIAQAEAMQLIVKRLEQWMNSQGVGIEMIEAAERGLRYQEENEQLKRRVAILEGEPTESEYDADLDPTRMSKYRY